VTQPASAADGPCFRYLSHADVKRVALPMSEIIDAVEYALVEKALGRTVMPTKQWIEFPDRWFDGMSSVIPALGTAVMKWQSGSVSNASHGLPYLTGMIFLNDSESGLVEAVMDSRWVAQQRTAAATAVTVKHLHPHAESFAMLGCGVQGFSHLEALEIVMPELKVVVAYDIDPHALSRYGDAVRERGFDVLLAGSAEEAVRRSDVVVTAGPIRLDAAREIQPGWLQPGALAVPIDFDSYWSGAAIDEVDLLVTDDVDQLLHLRADGYFVDSRDPDGDLGAVAGGVLAGRRSAEDRIMSVNMGVSVEDAATARSILTRARSAGIGVDLPL
jgi:ornithine cyclodeaminase/alanine dehydrogenase-like protein (mu-crystallin family)